VPRIKVVKLYDKTKTIRDLRDLAQNPRVVFRIKTEEDAFPIICKRINLLKMDYNLRIESLSKNTTFITKDGKIYVYFKDIHVPEAARILCMMDDYNLIVENYNAPDDRISVEEVLAKVWEDA
jgi:hypothetical protein